MTQYARYPSGSVSVSSVGQGAPNTAANAWPVLVTDGTRTAAVTAASAVKIDGSAVTQPVSAASLPLPTGAATAAKQPALGTAGSASADVITVQGVASMTALKVDGSAVTQPVSGTVAVTGTFWQATQPVSGTVAVTGTFWQATQPVSGTVAATQSGTWNVTSVTNTVTVDQTTSAATFQAEGSVAFGSLSTTFATVFTTGGAMKWLGMRNNTNGAVVVSLDGGTTSHFTLDAGDQVSLDLKQLGLSVATSTAIQAKYTGSAPTSGSFRVNGAR